MSTSAELDRRAFLRIGVAAAGTAAAASTRVVAQDGIDYGGWFQNTSNFDGTTVDKTGQSEVTVKVGAPGNGGNFAFAPPAIRVDPGTTVVWQWTGEGGVHNVQAKTGAYRSELMTDAGATYSLTFAGSGISKYFCNPHRGLGMKGAVVVGSPGGTPTVSSAIGESGPGGDGAANATATDTGNSSGGPSEGAASNGTPLDNFGVLGLFAVALVVAALSPLFFAALMLFRYRGGPEE